MEDNADKDRILNGARELFRKYGLRSVTMDDIAHYERISKKTLYQYFSDKDDMVTLLMRNYISREREIVEQLGKESKNVIQQLFNLSRSMKRDRHDVSPSLRFDLRKYHAKAWGLFLDFKYKFVYDIIVNTLKDGIKQGYFRPDINAEILSRMQLEAVTMVNDEEIFPPEKYNWCELQMNLLDHFIHGIATEKGKRIYKKYKNNCAQEQEVMVK